jgi:ABC-2 type transport system ATP-binding protein
MAPLVSGPVSVSDDGRQLSAGVESATGLATLVVRALDDAGVLVDNIEVRQPSLDDVFFSLTGGHIEEEGAGGIDDAGGERADDMSSRSAGPVGSGEGRHELEGVRA